MPKYVLSIVFLIACLFWIDVSEAQAQRETYGYGTVIGGERSTRYSASTYLAPQEEGMRIVLIRSRGSARGGGGGLGGAVQIYEVPRDTDFLELLVFYGRMDPRHIRQGKIRILRIEETGPPPFLSESIHRYWTEYSFRQEYRNGGPFTLLEPGDIIIVEGRGLFNRRIFDPISDINFILGLPALYFSIVSFYQLFR